MFELHEYLARFPSKWAVPALECRQLVRRGKDVRTLVNRQTSLIFRWTSMMTAKGRGL